MHQFVAEREIISLKHYSVRKLETMIIDLLKSKPYTLRTFKIVGVYKWLEDRSEC